MGIGVLTSLIAPATELFTGWQKRKRAREDAAIKINQAVTDAKIEQMRTKGQADIAWEDTALRNAGFKDEITMAIIYTPFILCFLGPWGASIVADGFAAIKENIPDFWCWAFCATVGVSYGLRKFTDVRKFIRG